MFESNLNRIDSDVQLLIKDAQALFHEAAKITGVKADALRSRGMQLLDKAEACAHEVGVATVAAGKEAIASADTYVKENPWRTAALAAGAALLIGMMLGRNRARSAHGGMGGTNAVGSAVGAR